MARAGGGGRAISRLPRLHGRPTAVAGTTPPMPVAAAEARRSGGAGAAVAVLVIVTLGALTHVGVRLKGLEVAYELGQERRVTSELEEQRRQLQIEIGMLKDPGRVSAFAQTNLDMGPPAPEAIVRLGPGARLPVAPSATRRTDAPSIGATAGRAPTLRPLVRPALGAPSARPKR